MQEYEFRILNRARNAALITAEVHMSDHAAIKSARKLAQGCDFKVWRGFNCIHGAASEMQRNPEPPQLPVA